VATIVVKANELTFQLYFFTVFSQLVVLLCCVVLDVYYHLDRLFIDVLTLLLATGVQISLLLWNYRIHLIKKKNLLMKFRLKKKANYNNDLLTFLMPKFILEKLNFDVNDKHLADDAGEVTIMFVYICNFEQILEGYKDDIINLLDGIFKDFDILCDK